jgi:hypothetical protein
MISLKINDLNILKVTLTLVNRLIEWNMNFSKPLSIPNNLIQDE